jgi:hypothetical protein
MRVEGGEVGQAVSPMPLGFLARVLQKGNSGIFIQGLAGTQSGSDFGFGY